MDRSPPHMDRRYGLCASFMRLKLWATNNFYYSSKLRLVYNFDFKVLYIKWYMHYIPQDIMNCRLLHILIMPSRYNESYSKEGNATILLFIYMILFIQLKWWYNKAQGRPILGICPQNPRKLIVDLINNFFLPSC